MVGNKRCEWTTDCQAWLQQQFWVDVFWWFFLPLFLVFLRLPSCEYVEVFMKFYKLQFVVLYCVTFTFQMANRVMVSNVLFADLRIIMLQTEDLIWRGLPAFRNPFFIVNIIQCRLKSNGLDQMVCSFVYLLIILYLIIFKWRTFQKEHYNHMPD